MTHPHKKRTLPQDLFKQHIIDEIAGMDSTDLIRAHQQAFYEMVEKYETLEALVKFLKGKCRVFKLPAFSSIAIEDATIAFINSPHNKKIVHDWYSDWQHTCDTLLDAWRKLDHYSASQCSPYGIWKYNELIATVFLSLAQVGMKPLKRH